MADYPVESKAGNKTLSFRGSTILSAGGKLTDVTGVYQKGSEVVQADLPITNLTALTVPAGKWAAVSVRVNVEILDSDPNA
jgi:hypothetical protein